MVGEDREEVEEEAVAGEQTTHLVVAAVEEARMAQMMNALVVVEDTSCWEEVGAPLHLV